ncbi:type VII secretion protein EccE, partial [Tsukamurella soli]|uniref:type VII secretion protein EccE n=1 Tax=Tsukamurella soli TaxID=644556 RepID=UPI0031E94812
PTWMLWRRGAGRLGAAERLAPCDRLGATRWTGAPTSVAYPGGGAIGVAHHRGRTVAALRLEPAPPAVCALGAADQRDELPLSRIATALASPDTPADGIHIVIRGSRVATGSPLAGRYRALLGPLSDWALQEVTVFVETDATRCGGAVSRRGGAAGIAAVAALATRRVADLLAHEGIRSAPLPATALAAERRRIVAGAVTVELPSAELCERGAVSLPVRVDGPAVALLSMRPAAPLTGSGVADAVAVCAAVTAPAAHFPDGARHARSVPPTPAPDARLGVRP